MKIGPIQFNEDILPTEQDIQWSRMIDFMADLQEMRAQNYDILLQKVRNIAQVWSLRSLTLLGKVLIINSLLVSQMVYKLLCLYSPSEVFYKQYKDVIVKFMWDKDEKKGKSLVAYDKLILKYEHGGLRLIDLPTKDLSPKATSVCPFKHPAADNSSQPVESIIYSAGLVSHYPKVLSLLYLKQYVQH